MRLYQEILFLRYNFTGFFIVENVKPYYRSLIEPTICLQRHLFWTNIPISLKEFEKDNLRKLQIKDLELKYNFDLSKYKLKNKRQILRNCVNPEIGRSILEDLDVCIKMGL